MAIKNLRQGLPIIGKAKIGQPRPDRNGKRQAPEKFDHIELTGVERDDDGALIPDIDAMKKLIVEAGMPTCGGCDRSAKLGFRNGFPTRIPIYLPYNDLELALPHSFALYKGRNLLCTGDGDTAQRREVLERDGNRITKLGDFAPFDGPCGSDECPYFKARQCKPHAKLHFVLATQEVLGGVYVFQTTSWNSIANMVNGLEAFRSATGGVIQYIPLYFEIAPQTVNPKDGPANTQHIARIIFPGGPEKLLAKAADSLKVRAPLMGQIRALEASIDRGAPVVFDESPEEVDAIEREWLMNGDGEGEVVDVPPEESAGQDEEPAEPEPEPFCAKGEGDPLSAGEKIVLRAKAQKRAVELGATADDWTTVVGEACGCGLDEITLDHKVEAEARIEGYEQAAA